MPLNVPKINALKPKDKDYKQSDEKGLFLLVKKKWLKVLATKIPYKWGGKIIIFGGIS